VSGECISFYKCNNSEEYDLQKPTVSSKLAPTTFSQKGEYLSAFFVARTSPY